MSVAGPTFRRLGPRPQATPGFVAPANQLKPEHTNRSGLGETRLHCPATGALRYTGGVMLWIPGHPARCCEGLSRREWLRVGGLGAAGLSLPILKAGRA